MNISKLSKFAWAIFALALTTTTVFAQGWRNGNNVNLKQNSACLYQISDLTNNQKDQIQELANSHQTTMAELRENRRSTSDINKKNEIRKTMLENVDKHQNEVKSLLTENQKKQYDLLNFRDNNLRTQNAELQRTCRNYGNGYKNGNNNQNRRCSGNQNGKRKNRNRNGYNSSNS